MPDSRDKIMVTDGEPSFGADEFTNLIIAAASSGGVTMEEADLIQIEAEKCYVRYLCFKAVAAGELGLYVKGGEIRFLSVAAARRRHLDMTTAEVSRRKNSRGRGRRG